MDRELLIDRIYEAAAMPQFWPDLLADLAVYGGGDDSAIFTYANGIQRYITSPNLKSYQDVFERGRWGERSDRPARIIAAKHHGFITDLDVYTMDEIERSPVYQEWLIPYGWGWGVGTHIAVPNGDDLFVTVERAWKRGPAGQAEVDRMDALRPHLARAAVLSSRIQSERAQSLTDLLETLGLPAVILNDGRRTVAMNAGAEALLGTRLLDGRTMSLKHPGAQQLFTEALDTLHCEKGAASRSIPMPASRDQPATVVHVLPVRRSAQDVFASLSAVVVLTPLTPTAEKPAANLIAGLFDLTPTEAKVAAEIAALSTVDETAARFGTSVWTVRSQLKSVFAKTGTQRQSELVSLISGIALGASRSE